LGSSITPLPCNRMHVFHTKCIKEWLPQQDICPLCKRQVDIQECINLAKDIDRVYPSVDLEGRLSPS